MLHAIHDVVLRFGIGDQHTNEPALQHSVKIACPRLVLQRRRGGRLPFRRSARCSLRQNR